MIADDIIRVQGRSLSWAQVGEIQSLVDEHPEWSRHRLSQELCKRWRWQTPSGLLKTFAARSLLLKLAQKYELRLPAVREAYRREPWGLGPLHRSGGELPPSLPIDQALDVLQPLRWQIAARGSLEHGRALGYLRHYHYLSCNRPVGSHLIYLVQDTQQRDLAVHLVGAAAWQCAPRDRYLGWNAEERSRNLHRLGNHSRFLILPWVRVRHLASHLLGQLTRRVSQDWQVHHGWKLEALETFVETGRFAGVSYRAANWQEVGQTTGRTRQEKHHQIQGPRKSVWVYGLCKGFRENLGASHGGAR